MKLPHDLTLLPHSRGAIASKLVILIALGAGAFWSARFAPPVPTVPEPGVAGAPVAGGEAPRLPALAPAAEPALPTAPAGDPFAGADVGSNPVLRHIAGIVEPKRTDSAAPAQPKAAAARASGTAREVAIVEAVRVPATSAQPAPISGAGETRVPVTVARANENALAAPPSATPPQATPAQAVPAQAAPTQAAPTQAAPTQLASTRAAPTQAAPTQAAPAPIVPPPAATASGAPEQAAVAVPRPQTPRVSPDADRVALARVDPAATAPVQSVTPPRTISRSVPLFPDEAIKAGIKTGRVLARVSIDAEGRVTESQILSARPPGYFERESQRALAAWRYAPPGRAISTDVELNFARE